MVVGEAERQAAVVQISPHGLLHSSYSCFCPLVEKIYSCVVHVFVCICELLHSRVEWRTKKKKMEEIRSVLA